MALGSGGAGGAAAPPEIFQGVHSTPAFFLYDIFNVDYIIMLRLRNCHKADSHKL